MVIALLLSDVNKPVRYADLSRVAFQCLCATHSMWKALSILRSAISYRELETPTSFTPPSQLLSAFDAHVGDCSCQTRAQMLWELVQFYNIPEKKDALDRAITMLQELRIQATLLLQEIELSCGKPRIPTLDALGTHLSVWQRIGFTRFLDHFSGPSDFPPERGGAPQTAAAGDVLVSPTPPPDSSHKRYQITVEPEWDTDNLFLVARFLTLCLLLSECKIAKLKSGLLTRVIVRVDLQLMYANIERELEALGLLPARRNAKPCDGKMKFNRQCDAMQVYVSIVTTDWVKKTVFRLGLLDFHQSLSEGLIVANGRGISCVATYPSTLLVRALWLTSNTPLLVAIQRFCSHGEFHNIYCRITRNPAFPAPAPSFCEMGEPNWFDVTLVLDEDIISSPWAMLPHVIMICMSGKGTIDDFRCLLLDSNQGNLRPSQPHNGTCQEIVDYVSKLKELNFARVIAHCFAHHNQFPFTLPDDEDALERVSDLMQKGLGKRASDAFKGARDGADDFGTGRSMNMFTIEHLVVEFPGMVLKELQGKPTVYGCKFES
ncbi:uncharacterized protein F5147DRAFT_671705 [Suillus discolor]|uniref:Uncharacterized protein n=1 Tax=Suillus discolor TaxID=1912936 RepID=A0A9P7JYM4_9AGAM|nr:uncharacterized protein F5147DRAFT_671705 [Suillus discolor]KAG2117199.1 hypothetical protein F5147DRAFT_671705 [Suillus discolor]